MRVGVVDPAQTRELRRTVLRPHQTPGEPLPGDDVPSGIHIGACDDDGTVISTCFVFPDPCPWLRDADADRAWHLRQMATLADRRGQGVGAAVLRCGVEYLLTQGAPLLWCHAREGAVPFYARHDFRRHGEIFIDPDHPIPHLRMWRDLREPSARVTSSKG